MRKPASRSAPPPRAADPVTIEIVRQGVMAVASDMKTTLMRVAAVPAIDEAEAFAAGLFTPAGETVAAAVGTPMLIRGMARAVCASLERFGADAVAPGDVYITNDPAVTGSGLDHVAVTLPVFLKNALVGFACCVARWPDIGGAEGGTTTDVFAEGLQLPVLKYHDRGKLNEDLAGIVALNVRDPDAVRAVLAAQVAAVASGERRFLELVACHGREETADAIAAVMDRSEARARAAVRAIPDGVYEAESFLDDDGVTLALPVVLRVRAAIAGDEVTVDLSGLSRQVRGFYNGGAAAGEAVAEFAFRCLIAPADGLLDDGALRCLKTVLPPGRVLGAVRPAAMRSWTTCAATVADTVFRALAPAVPERVIAGHHADPVVAVFHGSRGKTTTRTAEAGTAVPFAGTLGPLGGGFGAKRSGDGIAAAAAIGAGRSQPTEEIEAKFPLVVERHALVPDSGGPGRHRGGLGVERVVRARADLTLSTRADRAHCRPWGLAGGRDGRANAVALRLNGHWKTEFTNAKLPAAPIRAGDAFRLRSGGGGGYGPPLERPVADVLHDVRQGYVSAHEAGVFYGVVVDPQTFRVNEPATALIRGDAMPLLPPPEQEGS